MKILGIETSCDETAVCLLDASGGMRAPKLKVLGNAVYSQVQVHEKFGGVFPMLAKREHAANLIPLLNLALTQASAWKTTKAGTFDPKLEKKVRTLLEREPGLADEFLKVIPHVRRPNIDAIAVTRGPGLEPALWVGVNFAKALSLAWNISVLPVNHMEGHIASILVDDRKAASRKGAARKAPGSIRFPAIALLVSGGHTELVLAKDWASYRVIGDTRDDAVGEAFDKVARMLQLPYPGGPHISRLAAEDRERHKENRFNFPRPMIGSGDFDFSFSGLKTAVLYETKRQGDFGDETRRGIARGFEDAAVDVLVSKTKAAAKKVGARTLILGGGVSANRRLREAFVLLAEEIGSDLRLPTLDLSTDNAIMIAAAAYVEIAKRRKKPSGNLSFRADGNLKI